MNAELYRRAVSVFEEICQLPRSEHATALDKACAGDAELRAQVESLLEADHAVSTGDFLRGRALEDIAAMSKQPKVQVQVPGPNTVLAGFRLGARIGAGGMGAVFEAEDLKLQRRVAVKVMPLPSTMPASRLTGAISPWSSSKGSRSGSCSRLSGV